MGTASLPHLEDEILSWSPSLQTFVIFAPLFRDIPWALDVGLQCKGTSWGLGTPIIAHPLHFDQPGMLVTDSSAADKQASWMRDETHLTGWAAAQAAWLHRPRCAGGDSTVSEDFHAFFSETGTHCAAQMACTLDPYFNLLHTGIPVMCHQPSSNNFFTLKITKLNKERRNLAMVAHPDYKSLWLRLGNVFLNMTPRP